MQAANTGNTLLRAMKKQLGYMLFREGEGFGVVVPKNQCQPDNPAGSDWQLQEKIKAAHVVPDLEQPASTCQPVFQKCFILQLFSKFLRTLLGGKTELTNSQNTSFHPQPVIAGGKRVM